MEVLLAVSVGDTVSRDTELQQKLKVAWIYIVSIYITDMITRDILERQREFHWESLALRDKMMLPHLPQYSYHK